MCTSGLIKMVSKTQRAVATERASKLVRLAAQPEKFVLAIQEYLDTMSGPDFIRALQATAMMALVGIEQMVEAEAKAGNYITVDDILGMVSLSITEASEGDAGDN